MRTAAAGDGTLELHASIRDAVLEVLICDEGEGMKRCGTRDGLGIGLRLIGQLTQEVRVKSRDPPPGVRLRMTFAIS
jgi:anti-sigma regulatory factor (Ser/Thr protein kinase)